LYSKNSLIIKNKKNKITGIACLKNLDLYPFDICYESALLVVDELIIGIDKDCFEKKDSNAVYTDYARFHFHGKKYYDDGFAPGI
jgi:hypothetical protein